MKIMPGAVMDEETSATGEERDSMRTDIGNKVQETEQELLPKDCDSLQATATHYKN